MFVADQAGLDPTLPDVSIVIGGQERHLCFDFNGIAAAEKETGINLLERFGRDIDATNLRGLLWAGLLRESPALTIAEVGSWLNPRNMVTVYGAIVAAWAGSTSEVSEDTPTGEDTAQANV